MASKPALTTTWGAPVEDNQNSLTAGQIGPILLQDTALIDKLQHFDRERIPERVVHAKGAGAHGYFEVTHDITQYCKAKVFSKVGKRTPVFARFSTVGGEKGSADTDRDPRGFAVKFYTEDGNWDMVGNNTPIFFIRDPQKFPDFIHTQKRNPQTNLKDPDAFWDFLSLVPESVHQVSFLFSDRGTPYSYRFMNGYSSHTYKFVNAQGVPHWIKLHFKTEQGIKNFTGPEAAQKASEDPDWATRDLFEAIARGEKPSWKVNVQIMSYEQAWTYRWNPFDITKIWPHKDFPLIPFGRLVLDRNPENYFAEVEQSAFSPSHLVPGIEPSLDKMLQGRLFSYPDTHIHRLGINYNQLAINAPYATNARNQQRDGFATINNQGRHANYDPNSVPGEPVEKPEYKIHATTVEGHIGRTRTSHPNDDFAQPGEFYRKVLTPEQRTRLVQNIVGHLKNARKDIQQRQVNVFLRCDREYGTRVAQGLGLEVSKL